MLNIKDSVAVITGGAGGIGFVTSQYWIENGGKVVIADISKERVDEAVRKLGDGARGIQVNVCDEEDTAKLASFAIEQFGKINFVCPFAGIIKDKMMVNIDRETRKAGEKMTLAEFQDVIDINLTGVFLTVRDCMEQMINNDCKGLICLIASIGLQGTAGQINYSSSKAAVGIMPKVITAELFRRDFADKIRCVALAPGYVRTPILDKMNQKALDKIIQNIPIKRLIEPEEIASLAGELFRNQAITGDVFYIHGGLRLGSKG